MKTLLESLPQDIIIASGQTADAIMNQLDGLDCYVLGQNGNEARHNDQVLWYDALNEDEKAEIHNHIASLPRTWEVPDENDLIEDRGASITYSLYGHHAPIADKEKFDPEQARRIGLLAEHPLTSDKVEVKISGTTTLDYFKKGMNKGYNIARLCEYNDWNLDTCIYFGDALFPGGNDDTVIGVIDTETVKNPVDTIDKLTKMFL